MKRHITALFVATALAVAAAGTGLAQGEQGDLHNCAGAVTSAFAGPGFGQAVKGAAQAQAVDNFGLRNCGAAPGRNP